MADALSKTHLIPFELWYEDFAPGYPTIRISNAHASATIALHGGHVIDYIPNEQEPVIFTSREALFQEGKAIRGGIPICWPWFGAHPSDSSLPAHGFARNRFWNILSTASRPDGTEVVLGLDTSNISLWKATTELTLTIHVGAKLSLALTTTNKGTEAVTIGGALHSYFCVADIAQTSVNGLDGVEFLDTTTNTTRTQQGAIEFSSETDSVYTKTASTVSIHDSIWKREISIEKSGSQSTVVWNPWIDKAAALADLADDEYHDFLCVETCNALEDVHQLEPGASHTLATTICSTPFSA